VADLVPLGALFLDGLDDRTVRGAPGNQQQVALGIYRWHHIGNVLADGFHFRGADAHHFFVVQRLVVDIAGDFLFFDAADAVLQAWRAGNGPRPRQRLRIALIGEKADRIGGEFDGNRGNLLGGGDAPRLRTVGEISVGKDDD